MQTGARAREDAHCHGVLTTAVEDLDDWDVDRLDLFLGT